MKLEKPTALLGQAASKRHADGSLPQGSA